MVPEYKGSRIPIPGDILEINIKGNTQEFIVLEVWHHYLFEPVINVEVQPVIAKNPQGRTKIIYKYLPKLKTWQRREKSNGGWSNIPQEKIKLVYSPTREVYREELEECLRCSDPCSIKCFECSVAPDHREKIIPIPRFLEKGGIETMIRIHCPLIYLEIDELRNGDNKGGWTRELDFGRFLLKNMRAVIGNKDEYELSQIHDKASCDLFINTREEDWGW
jgi:hypothetical protein